MSRLQRGTGGRASWRGFRPSRCWRPWRPSSGNWPPARAGPRTSTRPPFRPEGNPEAMARIDRVFEPVAAAWRGLGTIPASGMGVRPEFATHDAARRLDSSGRRRRPPPTSTVAAAATSSAGPWNRRSARSSAAHARRSIRSARAWSAARARARRRISMAHRDDARCVLDRLCHGRLPAQ